VTSTYFCNGETAPLHILMHYAFTVASNAMSVVSNARAILLDVVVRSGCINIIQIIRMRMIAMSSLETVGFTNREFPISIYYT